MKMIMLTKKYEEGPEGGLFILNADKISDIQPRKDGGCCVLMAFQDQLHARTFTVEEDLFQIKRIIEGATE